MHQVLFIDELLREIFLWATPSDLFHAAGTCHTWKEPALDALYNHLISLKPLFEILASNAKDSTTSSTQLSLFHSYARRVRYLEHSTRTYQDAIPDCILHGSGTIFPLLKTVKVSLPPRRLCSLPPMVSLSPNIRELSLDTGFHSRKGHDNAATYLKAALEHCPRLESFTLRGLASAQANPFLSSMTNLHTLRLRVSHSLTADVFAAVAQFPHLAVLEIHAKEVQAADVKEIWAAQPALPAFPALENLWIRCKPELFGLVTERATSALLHTIYLDLETNNHTTAFWTPLLDGIQQKFSATLQNLSIAHFMDEELVDVDSRSTYTIRANNLRALAQCHQLLKLELDTTFPVGVCDSDFVQIVKWWPNLQSLEFSGELPDARSRFAPEVTFNALRTIATSLPRLTYLALPVNTTDITDDIVANLDVAGQHELKTLSIMFPHLPDTSLLPQYLHRLFPELPEVEYESKEWFADWVSVTSGMKELRDKRRHGKLAAC
ncbi:hypothetical protein CYLTODRAFT_494878 [Cylindrobasidium torrendii FP15055 ss-10]|uniref:F-box domain-containing protein n=1 Tax=Cylindrobasidium torrendii FP15055 ss-10 TaxID=1314674 RepID=A0A0D7AVQ2_9AGAR|nr:hypothetical protein CYLTODRAFT_494878 [Cylindrobasidium torrendii FP15055 ss-10]